MNQRIIEIQEIGQVVLKKNKRARRICFSIKPKKGLNVSLPYYVSYKEAEEELVKHIDWIKSKLKVIKAYEQTITIFTPETVFKTREHTLVMQAAMIDKVLVSVRSGFIKIQYPFCEDPKSELVQKAVKIGIEKALKKEAVNFLPDYVRSIANKYNFTFNSLSIRNLKF